MKPTSVVHDGLYVIGNKLVIAETSGLPEYLPFVFFETLLTLEDSASTHFDIANREKFKLDKKDVKMWKIVCKGSGKKLRNFIRNLKKKYSSEEEKNMAISKALYRLSIIILYTPKYKENLHRSQNIKYVKWFLQNQC